MREAKTTPFKHVRKRVTFANPETRSTKLISIAIRADAAQRRAEDREQKQEERPTHAIKSMRIVILGAFRRTLSLLSNLLCHLKSLVPAARHS